MKAVVYDAKSGKISFVDVPEERLDIPEPQQPTEPDLQAEIAALKARLAKVEAVPLVKTSKDPDAVAPA
jgi:hypothetical protein